MVGQMLGFVGEGLWIKKQGKLRHSLQNGHPHLEAKQHGFSAEFAVRFLYKPTKNNDSMHLLTVPGIVKFDLLKQKNKFKISARDLKTGKSIYSSNLNVDTAKPFSPDKNLYWENGIILALDMFLLKIQMK